jgi:glutamyl-Q tRNA(Asp) synthetase
MRPSTEKSAPATKYCGRFAPSPTGPLHFGSLVAAVASFLEARCRDGRWLLRMDDLDRPRCSDEAATAILRALECYGFEHDGPVVWQTQRDEAYAAALTRLQAQGMVYPCACSRRELADSRLGPDGAAIYPGTCRDGLPGGRAARAWRVRVTDDVLSFDDTIQGTAKCNPAVDCGDFVVKRADGLFAYQLAVVVDDAEAGVTDIVRGADLFHSTPRQIILQRLLGVATPRYAHVPVVTNPAGEKLSKQTLAQALALDHPVPVLWQALDFLGQAPPALLQRASLPELWSWARAHWRLEQVPRTMAHRPHGETDGA